MGWGLVSFAVGTDTAGSGEPLIVVTSFAVGTDTGVGISQHDLQAVVTAFEGLARAWQGQLNLS